MAKPRTIKISEFLPMKAPWFHILLTLADGKQHGYAIRAAVEERTQGKIRLWPATLYGAMRDMSAEGLIAELEHEPSEGDDPRRRYYELTALGKRVLAAEVQRLEELVEAARATRAFASQS